MDNNMNKQNKERGKGNNGKGGFFQILFIVMIVIISISFISKLFLTKNNNSIVNMLTNMYYEEVSYDKFIDLIEEGQISRVKIGESEIYAFKKIPNQNELISSKSVVWTKDNVDDYDKIISDNTLNNIDTPLLYKTAKIEDESLLNRLLEKGDIKIEKVQNDFFSSLLSWLFPIVLFFIIINLFMMKMSGMMNGGTNMFGIGKSQAKRYMQKETGITFKDVAGEDEAKESLVEIVDFLHNPKKYTYVGAKLPKGALLVGPPGTGKTLLAKAVAGEAKVPFFSMAGSDFVEMFAGVGASRVRDLFKQAKTTAPCIIFIDEIDAIGRARDARAGSGADSEREQTLNQLLSEMDGFEINNGIMVMAATNRPEVLDQALLRPGRFDRRIIVEKPDLKGRIEILKVHSRDVKLDETVDFEEIALSTSGAVGADLANMINEAAITAAKMKREKVCQEDLKNAVEIVLVGKEKKDRILSKEERSIVSYHEVGHALVSALQKHTEPVQKITIVPRTMGALGYVLQTPEEEKYLNTKKELEEKIVTFLAGRAAEEIVFDTVTTGASNDIEEATKIARNMITQYGMNEKFGLMGLATKHSQYLDNGVDMVCGDATATEVDKEVKLLLQKSYLEAKRILKKYRKALDTIAKYLIEKETITGKEFMELFTKVTGIKEEKKVRVDEKKTNK